MLMHAANSLLSNADTANASKSSMVYLLFSRSVCVHENQPVLQAHLYPKALLVQQVPYRHCVSFRV